MCQVQVSLCKIERRPKMHWVILGFILCTLVTFSESGIIDLIDHNDYNKKFKKVMLIVNFTHFLSTSFWVFFLEKLVLCSIWTISRTMNLILMLHVTAPKPKGLEIEQNVLTHIPIGLYPACVPQYYKSKICRACCDTQYQIYGQSCPYSHPRSYCYNCCFF